MDSANMNRLVKALLIRGEQLANIEGAIETARLLQGTASLLNYFGDERSWGLAADELHALRDYAGILRSCFGQTVHIECALPEDRFIRRRVLLGELLEICSMDRILSEESGKMIHIRITMQEGTDEGTLCRIRVSFDGDGSCENIERTCRC